MINWWNEANVEKNNGLYVDSRDFSNWHIPQNYKEEDAMRAKGHAEILIAFVNFFFEDIMEGDGFIRMKASVLKRGLNG